MNSKNLDQLCAHYGWQIADHVHSAIGKNAENHITKSLGVLQENGVYAFFLYQLSRGKREKPGAIKLVNQAVMLLSDAGMTAFQNGNDLLFNVREKLADDLDNLLLAKRLLEQSLIYARYHVKAMED